MDELSQLRAEMLRGNQAKSQLAGLDEQFTRANSMRDAGMTAPNKYGYASPLQAVADIMKNSTGRRQARELAPQREAARQAIGASASALPLYQAQQSDTAATQAQANYQTNRADKAAAANALARTMQQQKDTVAKAKREAMGAPETWISRDGKNSYTGFPTDEGFMTSEGLMDITQLIPYKEYSQATRALTKASKKDGGALDKVGSPDLIMQILGSEYLEPATGAVSPQRWAGKFGLDAGDVPIMGDPTDTSGEQIQALQAKMSDIGIDSVKTNLKGLGVNPTDKDLEVAFASIPTAGTEPLAWAIWTRDQYLPMLRKASEQAVRDGTANQDQMAKHLADIEAQVALTYDKYDTSSPVKFDDAEELEYQEWKASRVKK